MSRFAQLGKEIAVFAGLRRGDDGLCADGAVPLRRALSRWVFFLLTYTVVARLIFGTVVWMIFGPMMAYVSVIGTYAAGSRPAPRHRRAAWAMSAIMAVGLGFSADRFSVGHSTGWTRLGLSTFCSAAASMTFVAVTHWPAKSVRAPTDTP